MQAITEPDPGSVAHFKFEELENPAVLNRSVSTDNLLGVRVVRERPRDEAPMAEATALNLKDEVDNITELVSKWEVAKTKDSLDDRQNAAGAVADAYYESKEFKDALEYYQRQYKICCEMFGEETPAEDLATVLDRMGHCCNELEQYLEAERHYRRSLDIQKRVFGEETEKCALCYSNLGFSYRKMAKYRQAKEHYLKAVQIRQSRNPEGFASTNLAGGLVKLGTICSKLSDFEGSVLYYTRELEMRRKLHSTNPMHESIAKALFSLGFNYNKRRNHPSALKSYLKSYEIYQVVWTDNPEHNDIDVCLYNLGCTYEYVKKYDEAVDYFKMAIRLRERRYKSETHAKVKNACRALANVLDKMPEFKEEAEQWRNKSL